MGIPHLTSTLQPFAVRGSVKDEAVVIDGPALAYHVHYICRRNGIGHPSYSLLGHTAIAWLDKLASLCRRVDAIYFDGYLPMAKRPVRMERMVKNTGQLNQFYATCPDGCAERHLSAGDETKVDLFDSRQPDSKQLLPPSFLVPAVIDALKGSPEYGSRVHQVPGEADAFCAKHLATHGGVVLTSDSDLLLHDLGVGRVIFLRDIYTADAEQTWECLLYEPRSICQRFQLRPEDIHRLGYELCRSPHATISQLVRNCKEPVSEEEDYNKFSEQYLRHETSPLPTLLHGGKLPLRFLDPRVSELTLQLGNDSADGEDAKMFLPVLIENPMRGSAWEPSTSIRQLAYTIFRWIVPGSVSSVQEYRRVQTQQQKGKNVSLLGKAAAHGVCQNLLAHMVRLKNHYRNMKVSYWLILSLILDIGACQEQEKKSHALRIVGQATVPKPAAKVSWDIIHFTSQLQASYYSLRILRQVLSVIPDAAMQHMPQQVSRLRVELAELPPLVEFPDTHGTLQFLEKLPGHGVVELLGQFVKVELPAPQPGESPKSAKKRKKTARGGNVASKRAAKLEPPTRRNMFSLLPEDG